MKSWYRIQAKNNGPAEISIYDEIGLFGINAAQFEADFREVKGSSEITLYLNTPGGSVFDGMAIYNMLAGVRDKVTVEVMGVAASIGSIIALSGRALRMAEGTYLMVHNPWAVAIGDSGEMLRTAELLDKMRGEFANIYESRSTLSRDDAMAAMEAETWYTASEAAAAGFVEDVIEYEELAAMSFDYAKYGYAHVPSEMPGRSERLDPDTWRAYEKDLRDAGMSRAEAKRFTAVAMKIDQRDVDPESEHNAPADPPPTDPRINSAAFDQAYINELMQEELAHGNP